MTAARSIAAALGVAAGVLVVGSGLAAIDVPSGEGCLEGRMTLVPFGSVDCMQFTDMDPSEYRPSTAALVGWLAATAAIFAVALRFRRAAAARGMLTAACVLALYVLLSHSLNVLLGPMSTPFFALPLVFFIDRVLDPSRGDLRPGLNALLLPTPVVVVGALPWFFGYPEVGVPIGLVTGATIATTIEQVTSLGRRAASP